jgi:hypothetical protein
MYIAVAEVISFFLSLPSCYLIIVGVDGYCCIRWHSRTHTHTHTVEFLQTRDRPVADTSTWKHTTLTRERHPCPRLDSNQQSQQASGCKPTPWTARLPASAVVQVPPLCIVGPGLKSRSGILIFLKSECFFTDCPLFFLMAQQSQQT